VEGGTSYIAIEPPRSRFAQFDPKKKGEGYILGAGPTSKLAGAALGTVGARLPFARAGELGVGGGKMMQPGIKAYHGSPHEFERFSSEHIGTGEGAQAYGHGLYFAENPEVAAEYKNRLSDPKQYTVPMTLDGKPIAGKGTNSWTKVQSDMWDKGDNEGAFLAQMIGDANRYNVASIGALKKLYQRKPGFFPWKNPFGPGEKGFDAAFKALRKRADFAPRRGRMYEVNIAAEREHFLDWDKPLSEQSEQAKKVLEKLRKEALGTEGVKGSVLSDTLKGDPTGGQIISAHQNEFGGHGHTKILTEAGIPGIKYLDQGSRIISEVNKFGENWFIKGSSTPYKTKAEAQAAAEAAGQATSNFVVFNDALINVIRKYGIAAIAAIPPAFSQMQKQ
jgi:hypothetical protein